MINNVHLIFYVKEQNRSTSFYQHVLDLEPHLNVPGMSEFELCNGTVLGLMPGSGIKKLLGEKIEELTWLNETPSAELYLLVNEPQKYFDRALKYGAKELSGLQPRDWGDQAAYCSDPDGYILAFAKKIKST